MQEVAGAEARKVYVGSPSGGFAWWSKVETTYIIVAIRVTDTCAVYSSSADPSVIQKYVDSL